MEPGLNAFWVTGDLDPYIPGNVIVSDEISLVPHGTNVHFAGMVSHWYGVKLPEFKKKGVLSFPRFFLQKNVLAGISRILIYFGTDDNKIKKKSIAVIPL